MPLSPLPSDALHSLDALPGEAARPPLRLLERPEPGRSPFGRRAAPRGLQAGWLDRLRRVLSLPWRGARHRGIGPVAAPDQRN